MKDEIQKWLRFENFQAGLALLSKYSKRLDLVAKYSKLQMGNSFARAELKKAMNELLNAKSDEPSIVPSSAPIAKKTNPKLDKQHETCKTLLRERSALHTRAKQAKTDDERYELANQIKELTVKIDAAYKILRHVETTGELPMSETDEAKLIRKGLEMASKLQSLKTQLSAARKSNAADKIQYIEQEIAILQEEMKRYDQ